MKERGLEYGCYPNRIMSSQYKKKKKKLLKVGADGGTQYPAM
jgi:hypothetical protein